MNHSSPLQSIYLFSDFTQPELDRIESISEKKNYVQGQDIFSRGEEAAALFVVLMGTVKLTVNSQKGDEIQIKTLGNGSHFGEMPFIDGEKRSTTVQAMESSTLLEIPYSKVLSLLEKDSVMAVKFYRAMARFLALRLRSTTQDLNQVKELRFHQ